MTAGDFAAVLVTVVIFAAFVVLLYVTQGLLRVLRDLNRSLDAIQRETLPLLTELRQSVESAEAEVQRVDDLLGAAESISATVESASRLSYLAFRAPLIKAVAFFRGIGRFFRRLGGGEQRRSRRRAARRETVPSRRKRSSDERSRPGQLPSGDQRNSTQPRGRVA